VHEQLHLLVNLQDLDSLIRETEDVARTTRSGEVESRVMTASASPTPR